MTVPRIIDCRRCQGEGVLYNSERDYFEGRGTTCPACLGGCTEEIEPETRSLADLEQEDFDMIEAKAS